MTSRVSCGHTCVSCMTWCSFSWTLEPLWPQFFLHWPFKTDSDTSGGLPWQWELRLVSVKPDPISGLSSLCVLLPFCCWGLLTLHPCIMMWDLLVFVKCLRWRGSTSAARPCFFYTRASCHRFHPGADHLLTEQLGEPDGVCGGGPRAAEMMLVRSMFKSKIPQRDRWATSAFCLRMRRRCY